MPHLDDPHFEHTVIYLCQHTEAGAMGIVINRPSKVDFTELADHLEMKISNSLLAAEPIYHGSSSGSRERFHLAYCR
ncbi:YqgE/AlgH family protein [Marinomonas sp. GJ51-6]|uniref:YqgE/AlgH family protein n=1 Tax=Marinomonas sp. GJ51-6 TaxID=2992802 RepID=UPI002934F167|nr:YqgE/AlgH family protein [Marinomonas sp. GJ51-6]WOD09302.1 YqgE/AlgH family protein [Marinomonas sp. GJ51-6]